MILIRKIWWPAIVLLFAIGITTMAHAQFSANVQGTVSDTTGAVVANASVTLHNVDTGIDAQSTTNGSGFYRFSSVAPGNYTVNVASAGFSSTSVAVLVTTAETRGVDVILQVSKGATAVTVRSVASALNPDETRIQTTISSQEIGKLPLPNRDVQLLIALTPGVVGFQNESPSLSGYGNSLFSPTFEPPYSANGLGNNSNLFLIDDLPVNSAQTQGAALMLPNAEMIDEVALQTQTYSVENGSSASLQTAFTTKGGTNGFHGSADESYYSSNLGAAKNPISQTLLPSHQNLVLGSLGGPIWRDRTFFFGSFERQDDSIGAGSIDNPELTNQFAQWALATFPNSGAAKSLVFAPLTRIAPGPKGVVKYANDPSYSLNCGTNQTTAEGQPYNLPCNMPVYDVNYFFNQTQPFDGTQYNVRLDQNFRDGKDKIYGMYERIDQKLGDLSERAEEDATTPSQNKYFSVNYVHLFSPKFLNEAHFGNLRAINGLALNNPLSGSIPYEVFGLDTTAGYQFEYPFSGQPFASQVNKEHTYAFRDTVTYTAGNHTIRGGYQYYRGDVFQDSSQIYARPGFNFSLFSTIGFISNSEPLNYYLFTIGSNGKYTPQLYGASSTYNSIFVEDNWKTTDRLTITAGIRYDNFGNPVPYGSTAQPFVPMFPGSGSTFQEQALATTTRVTRQAFTSSQNPNFMPRAGFAYTPFNDRSTLLHGGIGLYENAPTPFQIASNLPTQPPNRISLSETGILPYGDFKTPGAPYGYNYPTIPVYGSAPWGNTYSNAARTQVYSANLNGFVPDLKPEKAVNYSLGIDHQFAKNIVFGVSYVGSHGYDLLYGSAASGGGSNVDYNLCTNCTARPTDHWGQINYGRNGLRSNFNQMVVTLKQNAGNFSYQANYNWSRALQTAPVFVDDSSGNKYYWNTPENPNQYSGPTLNDIPNSFSFAGAYQVPKLFQNRFANEAASGWRISTIVIAQSGTPFTVYDPNVSYQNNGGFQGTSDTPGIPTYLGTKRSGFSRHTALTTGIFTTAEFVDPSGTGTKAVEPTQGPNTFRNFGYFNVDAGLAKSFSVPLPHRPQGGQFVLRGEAVNLFNHTNYQAMGGDVTNATTFGKVTAVNQQRYLQLGGRFEF